MIKRTTSNETLRQRALIIMASNKCEDKLDEFIDALKEIHKEYDVPLMALYTASIKHFADEIEREVEKENKTKVDEK